MTDVFGVSLELTVPYTALSRSIARGPRRGMADVPVGPGITLGGYTDADGVGADVVTGLLRGPSGTPVKLTMATRTHTNDSIKVRAACTVCT